MKRGKKKAIKHAVIIVNYNGWHDTIACLDSISKCKDVPHIIVVDNGSTDASVKELRAAYPNLDLIIAETNKGFAAGNNLGIKRALKMGAKVIYLLNNDTEVDPQLFFRAYRYVNGKNRIAVGKIYYSRGYEYHESQKNHGNILWYAGGHMDWCNAIAIHEGVDEEDHGQHDLIRNVEFATGCYLAIPRQVINKIGTLDESFFLYLEDAEYSLRAISAKIAIVYNPKLIIYHRNGGSTGAGSSLVDYYLTRNRFLIAKKYGSFRLRFALLREALGRNWRNPLRRRAFFDYILGHLGIKQ